MRHRFEQISQMQIFGVRHDECRFKTNLAQNLEHQLTAKGVICENLTRSAFIWGALPFYTVLTILMPDFVQENG